MWSRRNFVHPTLMNMLFVSLETSTCICERNTMSSRHAWFTHSARQRGRRDRQRNSETDSQTDRHIGDTDRLSTPSTQLVPNSMNHVLRSMCDAQRHTWIWQSNSTECSMTLTHATQEPQWYKNNASLHWHARTPTWNTDPIGSKASAPSCSQSATTSSVKSPQGVCTPRTWRPCFRTSEIPSQPKKT